MTEYIKNYLGEIVDTLIERFHGRGSLVEFWSLTKGRGLLEQWNCEHWSPCCACTCILLVGSC